MRRPGNGNYLVVEGNIGAGKTSLAKMLSETYNSRLILEQFTDNPFLPLFYEQPERYAFPVELFFMSERHKQLESLLVEQDLFQQVTVSDYIFSKTLLFASQNLAGHELRLFQQLFHTLNANFPKPDLLVYLHRSIDHLLVNIKKRKRSFEASISPEYLGSIQKAYFDFFRSTDIPPILLLDLEDLDFVADLSVYNKILSLLSETYTNGMHQIRLKELL